MQPCDSAYEEAEFRDLVSLRQYRDLSEAIIARGVIESAGIFPRGGASWTCQSCELHWKDDESSNETSTSPGKTSL